MEEQNTIASRVIKVMRKGLIKFAEEGKNDGILPENTQIIIALRPDKDSGNLVPFYRVWKNMQPYMRARKIKAYPGVESTDEVSFKTILGVKLDFAGYEETSKMFMIDTFARMQKEITETLKLDEPAEFGHYEEEAKPDSYVPTIEIFIVTEKNDPVTPVALLYYDGNQIRQLDFSNDIFIMPK